MEIVACPTTDQIAQLLRGEITGRLATELTIHIMGCSRCSQSWRTLEHIADGPQSGQTRPSSALPADADSKGLLDRRVQPGKLAFLAPAMSADEIGWLAHYRVLKVLGEGGMGIVLLAEDTFLGRAVALKVINVQYRDDQDAQHRFLREARAMAQVKSDHVVSIYHVGEHKDVSYIVMELLEGVPLRSLLEGGSLPPLRETLRIGREIAQALAAAHSRGLIHRDIKPENVWLEAPTGRVKLLDFGMACPQQVDMRLTASGIIMGSPLYMSPEQAQAAQVDERTDLFSLGCVLYELISGQTPFGRPTVFGTLTALTNETPPVPSQGNPDCPPSLDDLIMGLLAKEPAGRPKSAQLLIGQLEAIERDLPSTGEPLPAGPSRPLSPSAWLRARDLAAPTSQSGETVSSTGATAAQRSHSRRSERRQVTVLVCGCQVFGSDEYLANVDVEDQEKILQSFERSCKEAVLQWDGTVVQCNDESLIACFGYPVAHEDAAQLASSSALAILEALKVLADQIRRDHNLQLNPWLAIHTGPAVVATDGTAVSLVGEARSVAVRLKDVAAAGQIVLSGSTLKVLRGKFSCLSLGHHKIKGLERPIELFQLREPLDASDELSVSGPVELTPLIGRDQEMSLLQDRWDQAQEGMGQVVLLIGEAGLGKSRLVHAMKEHVSTRLAGSETASAPRGGPDVQGSPVVEWRCSPHFQHTGLYPASNFFQRLLHFRRDETPSAQFDRLVKHLEQHNLALKEVVPLFASLVSLPTDSRFPSLFLTPAREREEMFQVLKEWLQAYSARQPVLFVIEDLHWLDASTLEFLGQLLAEGLHDRILTLLTFRPEFRTPWPALAHQTSLALNRLTKRQVSELMQKNTGSDVPAAVIDEVYDRSSGVPLFVEEFTKMVKESGLLAQAGADGGWQVKSLMARAIPATLQDLIMARLDRMEGDRELAQIASALGREFSYELLAAVAGADAQLLETELAKLVKAEILYQKGRPPQSTYVFKHTLLENALYNAMVKDQRQQCHAQIAEALEARFPQTGQTQPEVVAHHFTEAGLAERSINYWLAAGLRSQEQFANVEAISHFTRGLEVLGTLPESPERDRNELSLLNPLGSAYQVSMGYAAPEVGPTFARARELCQRIGDSAELFEIMWGNWTWHLVGGDLELCVRLSDEIMSLARDARDKGMSMEAYVAPAVTLFFRGDFEGCREHCAKAIAEYEDMEQCLLWSGKLGQNSAVVHRCYLSLSLWHLGFPDQALQAINETLALARQIAHPFTLAHALYFACCLYQNCRLGNELKTAALEELAIAVDQRFALWQTTGTFHVGAAQLLQGDLGDALQKLESGVKSFRAIAASLTLPAQLAFLADGYIKGGRFKDAQEALDGGLTLAELRYDRSYLAELIRLKGVLALAAFGDQAVAESFFNKAIETARLQHSKAWELRATMSAARLWQQQGRTDQARTALGAVYGSFSQGMATPDLEEAKAIMASLA